MTIRLVTVLLAGLLVGCASSESTEQMAETQPEDDLVAEFLIDSGMEDEPVVAIDIDDVEPEPEPAPPPEPTPQPEPAVGIDETVETAEVEEPVEAAPPGTGLARTYHVRNDHTQPVAGWVIDSLNESLTQAGGRRSSGNTCDVVLVCRSRAQQRWEHANPPHGSHTRTTSLWAPHSTGGNVPPWQAVVEVIIGDAEADGDAPLRELRMRVSQKALRDVRFTRQDVSDWWRVLEEWAAAYPSTR